MTSIDDVMIEITPQVLLKAYACGIFPMAESAEDNALYWIEPERRGILPLDRVHVPRRLARTIRNGGFEVKVDKNFEAVIEGCAAPRSGRRSTWINGRIRSLYRELFALGHCHTIEVWQGGRAGRRALRRASRPRVFRREHVLKSARREQDRPRLSDRAAQIWRLHPARHAVRHRTSRPVRRDRGQPRRISAIARGRVGRRLGPRQRRAGGAAASSGGAGGGAGAGAAAGAGAGAPAAGGAFALLPEGVTPSGVLQLVSQTSNTGCSTA